MYIGYTEDRKKLSSDDIKELSYLKDNSKNSDNFPRIYI